MHWVCLRAVLSLGRALPHCRLKTRMQLTVVTTGAEGLYIHRGVAPEGNVPCLPDTLERCIYNLILWRSGGLER